MTPSSRVLDDLLGDADLPPTTSPPIRVAFMVLRQAILAADQAMSDRDHLERSLLTEIGYPRVLIPDGTPTTPRFVATLIELDHLIASGTIADDVRQQLRDELRTRQGQWRRTAEASGLTSLLAAEESAVRAVATAVASVFEQPIITVADVAVVLAVIIACGEAGPTEADTFPWRQLRALFTALGEL